MFNEDYKPSFTDRVKLAYYFARAYVENLWHKFSGK